MILPTGAVTFLFTDVEGSTSLWEERPAEMRSALEHHDRLLRLAIESPGGHIVKTVGDGVIAVFADAKNALAAALAAQRALQVEATASVNIAATAQTRPPVALKVRMGLHTGVADLRDGDYFGTSLNRAARVMSVAHGEQILLSIATADLVRAALPEGVMLRDMGEHRLKGLANAERLLQVVATGLREDFPPLASQLGYSLPAERDTFVGRSDALCDLERRFSADARLVSIIGIGGSGKTRLVTRFGWSALRNFAGGVWFCDLTPTRGLDGILHAVAQGLDLPLGKDDPVIQLGHAIAGRGRCLVILDNFEQVARHAEATLGRWLSRAPNARFLVTTREVLGLPGEEIVALVPLPAQDAVDLFLRRAKAAKPEFEPNGEDMAAIAPLVRRLDGLPLAIELAAVRVRVMPPRILLARMNERFKLLTSAGGRVDRQATLRAVFDWSWDLLSLPEKAALAQLSIFEGGFTVEAVEAVVDLSQYDNAPWPVDVLQSLVQKSFVRSTADDRFDLLVSVQEYAAEHLRARGRFDGSGPDALRDAQVRHGRYFAALPHGEEDLPMPDDLDNFVAACRRASARNDVEVATSALEGAWASLRLRGPFGVAVELADMVAAMPGLDPATAMRVDYVAGRALDSLGRSVEACSRLERCAARAREVGDRVYECRALSKQGYIETLRGHFDSAQRLLDAAAATVRGLEDPTFEANVENNQGILQLHMGHLEASVTHYEAALLVARRKGDLHLKAAVLTNLGTSYEQLGFMDRSEAAQREALTLSRAIGNRTLEGNALSNLGLVNCQQGRFTVAQEFLEAAVTIAREQGNSRLEAIARCNLGMAHHGLSHLEDAQREYETALHIARDVGDRYHEGQFLGYLGLLHAHCNAFGAARSCLEEGETLLRTADPVSLGVLLCKRAETEHLAGCTDAAENAAREASVIADKVCVGAGSELQVAIVRVRALMAAVGGNTAKLVHPKRD